MATIAFFIGKSCPNVGRYQILMHPEVRADQYLLDTKTGHVWHLVADKKDKLWRLNSGKKLFKVKVVALPFVIAV